MELGESRYGSDKAGLLCGYRFALGHAGRPIEADEAADAIATRDAGHTGTFLWLHFNLANQASERWLRQRLGVPDEFFAALHDASSTRVECIDDRLIAVINDVTLFGLDASNVSTLALSVAPQLIVSARHTPLRSVDRLRACVQEGERFRSAVELLAHLLRDQADVLTQVVRSVTTEVNHIEDKLLVRQVVSNRPRLGALRRMLVRLQRLLAPEPAALFRLLNRPPAWMSTDDVQDLRQSAEELALAVGESGAIVERVRLLQEELLALLNEQTSRILFVLTVVTVIALPMTIIPGLFGMNVGGVPLQHQAWGFWLVVTITSGLAGFGAFLAFRRRQGD